MWESLRRDSPRPRPVAGIGVYAACTLVFFAFAARDILTEHTRWNHFALLAEAWQQGRLDLGDRRPATPDATISRCSRGVGS